MTARPPAWQEPRPSELLIAAAAVGLWTYSRSAFHVEVLAPAGFRFLPGRLLLGAHRGNGDIPILCGTVYFRGGLWADHRLHLHFGARDDFFERGFLAGYPRGLPVALRRLFYPVGFGAGLRRVRVHPLRSAHRMKLGQALAALPETTPLDPLLAAELRERLRRRASAAGRPEPATAGEALAGAYADVLWQTVSEDDFAGHALDALWRRRAQEAEQDLWLLVELVRAGEPLLFFPEGQHSPHGEIGPLVTRGLERLLEDGAPAAVQYVAIAYDPLASVRPRAVVGLSELEPRPQAEPEREVLAGLRRTMPLTCGQVVAERLVAAASADGRELSTERLDEELAASVRRAAAEERPVDPALRGPSRRRRRLADCLATLERRRLLDRAGRGFVALDAPAVLADATLRRLAVEYASARERG